MLGDLRLDLSIPSEPSQVREALSDVRAYLHGQEATQALTDAVETVLAEVLNNIVEHAYLEDDHGTIHLEVHPRGGAVDCAVRDAGRALPNLVLATPQPAPSGRG